MVIIKPDETMILEIRHHWLAMLRSSILSFLLASIPAVILIVLNQFGVSLGTLSTETGLHLVSLSIFIIFSWILIVWTFFYIAWTNYFLDVLVLTDKRLVDVEQVGLFSRQLSELRLENIQDVRVEIHGFLETLFDFGNIHIRTASESTQFNIDVVPRPYKIKDAILAEYDKKRKEHPKLV